MAINITVSEEMNVVSTVSIVVITIGLFLGIKLIGHYVKKVNIIF